MDDFTPPAYLSDKKSVPKILADYESKIVELRAKNKELQRNTETQKRIISILAHDVSNPLNSIKSVIELKRTDILSGNDTAELLDMMTVQLTSTIKMVENVVNWGQLHLQFDRLQLSNFDLHALVENVFVSESLNSVIKNNQLVNHVVPRTSIYSDQRALEFILRNLISNSNKFTQNGSVTVNMQQKDTKTTIWVSDTGIGMTHEQMSKLFSNNSFKTTVGTNNEKGSGLGLMLVKEYIDRMDGTITVESKINKGTSFKIVL